MVRLIGGGDFKSHWKLTFDISATSTLAQSKFQATVFISRHTNFLNLFYRKLIMNV